ARPLLAPGAVLSPRAVRVVGVLAASEDLMAMNEVRLDWMAEDTGGLQYGPANELLWRHARSMQVSNLRYSPLSEPFLLLPEISTQQLLLQPDQLLRAPGGKAEASAAGSKDEAADGSGSCEGGGGSGSGSTAPLRHEVLVVAASTGRVDCVVCWTEYELSPGVWLSYAPYELQGRSEAAVLAPHVWQRVQYLSARPAVQAGDSLVLQVTLPAASDDLRVEYDEDVTAVQRLRGQQKRPQASSVVDGTAPVPPEVDPFLPEGEPLLAPSGRSSEPSGKAAAAANAGSAAAVAAAMSQSGLILPYHMSMLNDRQRTRCYVKGIRGAVEAAREARHRDRPPLVVLDVGSGTGLLSLVAARAGAECVESLAAPDAAYLPSAFRIVAALAHSTMLAERLREAEVDLLRVPDLLLLTEPVTVAQLFRRHGPDGEVVPPPPEAAAASSATAAVPTSANCVLYWFEADCGAGGWLSTQPGSSCTYFGHWVQNVHFLEEPLPLPPSLLLLPEGEEGKQDEEDEGVVGSVPSTADVGRSCNAGGVGEAHGEVGGDEGEVPVEGLRVLLSAECTLDRVKMSADWVLERQGESESGSEEEEEEEEEEK
ncbi:hypothetical protein VOLCADRAFT_116501, partial [Volvox carteri f. nagariensis]